MPWPIVDGHAYCCPPLREPSGFASTRDHLRYLQREMAEHHQPAWRLRDRTPGDDARWPIRRSYARQAAGGRLPRRQPRAVRVDCGGEVRPFSESQRLGDGTEAAHVAAP